jgi:hypothetical protein
MGRTRQMAHRRTAAPSISKTSPGRITTAAAYLNEMGITNPDEPIEVELLRIGAQAIRSRSPNQ